jgi:UDP:flavonoid glycosyltransferase YjiC (YdhE family)
LWRIIDRFWIDPDMLPGLNAARTSLGPSKIHHFLEHMEAASDASVGLFPPWFARRKADWPESFIDGHFPLQPVAPLQRLPDDLESFLRAGDAPIVFTMGTGHLHAARQFKNALGALRLLGKRGLFITTCAHQIPNPLPPDVQWQAHAPFDILLPRVAMLVHHGGIGTTAEALRAGVQQLILPFAFDQFDNGRRIQRLGAGEVLLASRASARRMCRAIERQLAFASTIPKTWPLEDLGEGQGLQRLADSVEQALRTV